MPSPIRFQYVISIHAPLRERLTLPPNASRIYIFQSTLPCGSDSKSRIRAVFSTSISIHAPLRERLRVLVRISFCKRFQSTLPCGSDHHGGRAVRVRIISIHAPLRERLVPLPGRFCSCYFNPRSLAGATLSCFYSRWCFRISIHAPLRERPARSFLV